MLGRRGELVSTEIRIALGFRNWFEGGICSSKCLSQVPTCKIFLTCLEKAVSRIAQYHYGQ
jgi:hypothetical protein